MLIRNLKILITIGFVLASLNLSATSIDIGYPETALNDCVEGFVEFTLVVSNHRATEIEVTNSEPAGYFEEHASKAIHKIYFTEPEGSQISGYRLNYEIEDACQIQT